MTTTQPARTDGPTGGRPWGTRVPARLDASGAGQHDDPHDDRHDERRDAGGGTTARRRAPLTLLVGAGALVLLASVLVAVTLGASGLGVAEVVRSVGTHAGLDVVPLDRLQDAIVWQIRLPRVLTAAAVGAGLALAGAVMQSLTRNPLADPYLLGLSSGASVGAVAVLLLGLGVLLPVAAFVGALAALLASLALARTGAALSPGRAVLAGLAVSQLCAALTSFVIFWTAQGDSYREILTWLMGSLAGAHWSSVGIAGLAVLVVGTVLAAAAGRLDAFAFGDTAAAALGVAVDRTRWTLLVLVAVLTGCLVAVSGSIGFVGLVVPHAVATLTGPSHRRLLPVAALAGAVVLVWADTLARTVFEPRELPVGIVTALIGVPVFAVLLRRGRGPAWA
ncbi:putative F420-0 ABC transporter permease subunit [Cellulomonas marina]|uniref:Iron complex transport system permease protein n=1 Tax=Cellulomonas marina TaxID=988821 RepID=A0A1I0VB78_9CELL|nr:putative F420-0 ABC transporter permease subunit [Cellulomonas marina]GIG29172.1 ABC transporter permease [Cellulomonas marina]SFA73502.1 iron complex transport system permease protein [Cellulomonas marina]